MCVQRGIETENLQFNAKADRGVEREEKIGEMDQLRQTQL